MLLLKRLANFKLTIIPYKMYITINAITLPHLHLFFKYLNNTLALVKVSFKSITNSKET